MGIEGDLQVTRTGVFPSRLVGGDGVIVNNWTGEAVVTNGLGYEIWNWIADNRTLDELTGLVVESYQTSFDEARVDVANFVEDLQRKGLVELKAI